MDTFDNSLREGIALLFAAILLPISMAVFAWSLRRTKMTGTLMHRSLSGSRLFRTGGFRKIKKTGRARGTPSLFVLYLNLRYDFFFFLTFTFVSIPGASCWSISRPCLACCPYTPLGSNSTAF
jgi:hypothetical protein